MRERELKEYVVFEGVEIQQGNVPWVFDHPETGRVSIDSYSIWDYGNHAEIARRLASGQRCAIYMMGNFGVGEIRELGEKQGEDVIFDKVKQRDRMQTLVAFVHPAEIGEMIDVERLPQGLKDLNDPVKRLSLFAGPMHMILPIKPEKTPDMGKVRETKEAAFFWIPGHKAYEKLAEHLKGRVNGFIAGGSLNIHGQEPCFTTSELRDREMVKHKEWLENIDFVILDEISESSNIARSHTQVSFMQDPPKVVRLGSVSVQKIKRDTGLNLEIDLENVRLASSATSYNLTHNQDSDRNVEIALARMARFQVVLDRGGKLPGPVM